MSVMKLFCFFGIIGFIAVCLVFFINFLNKRTFVHRLKTNPVEHRTYMGLLAFVIVLTPVITLIVSNNDFLRYGLEKKTSYRLISISLDKLSDIDFDGFGSFHIRRIKPFLMPLFTRAQLIFLETV